MFVAWRDLRFAKGRFALMGSVVVLITVLVGLLSGLTAGLGRQNISAITGLPAGHLAFAAPPGTEGPSFGSSVVTREQWRRWAAADDVRSAEPLGITMTRAAVAGEGPEGRTASVAAFGVRPSAALAPDPPGSAGGVREGHVVLSGPAADEMSLRAGEELTLGGETYQVAAVLGDAYYSHAPVVWTSLADWQHLAPGGGQDGPRATVIALDAAPGADLAASDERFGTVAVSREESLSAIGSYTSENGSLQLMRGFLFAISALVIGAFFTVWTIQRSGDVAVLKALGASTGHLLRDALGQAVVLLTVGTLSGTALAAAAGAALDGTVPFVLEPGTVLFPAAVMILLGALGAALSIRRITSVDPLTALGSAR